MGIVTNIFTRKKQTAVNVSLFTSKQETNRNDATLIAEAAIDQLVGDVGINEQLSSSSSAAQTCNNNVEKVNKSEYGTIKNIYSVNPIAAHEVPRESTEDIQLNATTRIDNPDDRPRYPSLNASSENSQLIGKIRFRNLRDLSGPSPPEESILLESGEFEPVMADPLEETNVPAATESTVLFNCHTNYSYEMDSSNVPNTLINIENTFGRQIDVLNNDTDLSIPAESVETASTLSYNNAENCINNISIINDNEINETSESITVVPEELNRNNDAINAKSSSSNTSISSRLSTVADMNDPLEEVTVFDHKVDVIPNLREIGIVQNHTPFIEPKKEFISDGVEDEDMLGSSFGDFTTTSCTVRVIDCIKYNTVPKNIKINAAHHHPSGEAEATHSYNLSKVRECPRQIKKPRLNSTENQTSTAVPGKKNGGGNRIKTSNTTYSLMIPRIQLVNIQNTIEKTIKKKVKNMVLSSICDYCSKIGNGELYYCEKEGCTLGYHLKCLSFSKPPSESPWICPEHPRTSKRRFSKTHHTID